jgi:hypothetical protein
MGEQERRRQLALWLAILLVPCVLVARRVYVFIQPGIAGIVAWPALPVLQLLPVLLALHAVFADPDGARRVLRLPGAWVVFACLGADSIVYFLAAWIAHSAPLGVDLVARVLPSMAALLIGAFIWRWRPAALHGLVAFSVIGSAFVGLLQISQRAGLDTLPGRWLMQWDRAQFVDFLMNYDRPQGLETNANIYASMAVVGILWALFGMPRGRLRTATIASSVVISVLSQSRTTMSVILGVLAVSVVAEWSERRSAEGRRHLLLVAAIVASIAFGLVALRFGPISVTPQGLVTDVESVELAAPSSDASAVGRLDVWRRSVAAIAENPWGHFEGSNAVTAPLPHTHNEALFRLLYAGPVWLATHLVFLLWLALWLKSKRYPWTGVAIAVALFINGLTEPLWPMFPYAILLYLIIGAMMWTKAAEQADSFLESPMPVA